eukprot:3104908-Amphidinium_carterae.1
MSVTSKSGRFTWLASSHIIGDGAADFSTDSPRIGVEDVAHSASICHMVFARIRSSQQFQTEQFKVLHKQALTACTRSKFMSPENSRRSKTSGRSRAQVTRTHFR